MRQIKELIQLVDGWESKTVGQITSALNTPIETVSEAVWTVQDLIDSLGMESAGLIIGALEAAGAVNPLFKTAFLTLSVVGLELGSQARQSMIETLGQVAPMVGVSEWTPELTAAIKRLGRPSTSIWTADGRSGSATNADVQAGLDALQHDNRKATLKQAGAVRWNAYAAACDALQPGDGDPVL